MIIQGGTGNGYSAKVTKENMLLVSAAVRTQIGHVSMDEGRAFSLPFSQISAGGADDCILYLKNDSEDNLVLSQMWITCSLADEIYAKMGVVGTAAGGTAPVPVNLNTGSAKLADATTRQHTAITGLTGGNVIFRSYFTADAISQRLYFEDAYILQKNGTWALFVTTAAANTLRGQIMFFYHGGL